MILKHKLLVNLLLYASLAGAQNFGGVYKIDQLTKRIQNPDTLYVVNFWATWCKPCVEELPGFDSLLTETSTTKIKILLVNIDFKEELDKKVKPFLLKHGTKAECILLDEVNGNDFIDKISPSWSGAIPATLFKKGAQSRFSEKKLRLKELREFIAVLEK